MHMHEQAAELLGKLELAGCCTVQKKKGFNPRVQRQMYCRVIGAVLITASADVTTWRSSLGFKLCSHRLCSTLISLVCGLHTCKEGECGSQEDDSSVVHLIFAWPYLGFPDFFFFSKSISFFFSRSCLVEGSRRRGDNMMSSFLLSLFFTIILSARSLIQAESLLHHQYWYRASLKALWSQRALSHCVNK